MELNGKVAIITGASAGIGRAYALAFAAAGATVVAAARSVGKLEDGVAPRGTLSEVVQAAKGLPGRVYAQICDVEKEADVARMMDETAANFGRIDVLVNNAGVYPHYDTLQITTDEWDWNMRVNVRGPYLTMRHAAPYMIRQKSGSMINLTSASANPTPRGHAGHDELGLYGVTKAALNRLTTYMAEELKPHGIAVNAISPGGVLTDTWAKVDPAAFAAAKESGGGKPATPEVMGPALIYLAQQTAETMTGQIVHTDTFRKTWP
jgi:NAD(P)-dependent dehydrogenase (short-subunit alcohol dehydrogenase family)